MGFPENILTKDEKVVRSLHPHWLTIFKPVVIGLLIVAVAAVIVWLTPVHPSWDITDWVVIGIGIIAVLWIVGMPILTWRTTHYVITNKRVVVRRGILTKSGQDIALSKITDVSFRQTLLDRITKAGSLNIETAGDSPDEDFSSVPRSNEIQQLLNHLIEQDAAAKGGFGEAAHRGHQMMGQRSYDDSPAGDQQYGRDSQRWPDDAQQPPQFEQPAGGRGNGGWDNGAGNSGGYGGANGGWDTGSGRQRGETRPYQSGNQGYGNDGYRNQGQGNQGQGYGNQGPGNQGYGSQGDRWETPPTR